MALSENRVTFGRTVLGPIFAEFALRLWIFLSNIENHDDTIIAFCARGGFRLNLIYERFLAATHLASPVPTCNLMVSRVAAVRTALAAGCPSALAQIEYEMRGSSLLDVAKAVGGVTAAAGLNDSQHWAQTYTPTGFSKLLACEASAGLRASIKNQAGLFLEHVETIFAGRKRAILCDTGLSGSTMQLLEEAVSDINWSCVLFARCNYKHLSTQHFKKTVGLSVQSDRYSPFNARSAVLRYWHLIEFTLEPALPSVSMFERREGAVRTNLEIEGWKDKIAPRSDEIFSGILQYIDCLPRDSAARQIMSDVDQAFYDLRRAFIWPTLADVATLDIAPRSLDFGRIDRLSGPACERGLRKALRGSLWREGAIAMAASALRWPILAGIETAHTARWSLQQIMK